MKDVTENVIRVKELIAQAALRSGRSPEEVKLVAVSKKIPLEKIIPAIEAGIEILGENYVQEAQEKFNQIGSRVRWHMVGHLQRNKAKHAINIFDMIHSVDSWELAQELNRRAANLNKTLEILIQVNLSGEATKKGLLDKEKTYHLAEQINQLPNLCLKGLMTMPPYFPDPEEVRPYFKELRELRDKMEEQSQGRLQLKELSMGMSHDFQVAIEEGATLVRIGTAIFGPRD